jgi:cytochrome c peroxidase
LGLEAVSGDSNQRGWFRIPSLRNLSFTAPYMHDGRFQTLEEVLDFYDSGVQQHPTIDPLMSHHARMGSKLTENEKIQIIAFLKCLDDYHFINSGEFSNPFE